MSACCTRCQDRSGGRRALWRPTGSYPWGRIMRSHLTPTVYQLDGIAVLSYHRGMAKRKTTLYIDDDVMTATKATAMAMHSTDSAFVEDALRAYLKTSRAEAA